MKERKKNKKESKEEGKKNDYLQDIKAAHV